MNAWGEPRPPNPVTRIIAVRAAQVGGAAAVLLATLAVFVPPALLPMLCGAGGVIVTAGLSVYYARTFNPRTTYPGGTQIARLPVDCRNAVALTFDDGPHPDTTPRILDALRDADARATFFLVGERAARYPEITRRIAAEGHMVGIHGLRHRTMVLQSEHEIERELTEAVALIEAAADIRLPRPLLLRPPYGFKTATVARAAGRLGFVFASWSLDPRDYDPITAEWLLEWASASLAPGAIVLLHERPDSPVAVDALPALLALCRARGLSPMALSVAVRDFTHQPASENAQREENHQQTRP